MIKEKEYIGQGFELKYTLQEDGVVITGFHGRSFQVIVPEKIEELPVVEIERKAFLSRKNLREIVLPVTIRRIGDWAFAYCGNLEKIVLPGSTVDMGRSVFLDCNKLEYIDICRNAGADNHSVPGIVGDICDQTGRLMAAAVTTMDAYYLLDTAEAGGQDWLQKWDARLLTLMEEEDLEGYQKQVLCGEEDYGSTDVNAYLQRRRMYKVRLAMLRLLNSGGLAKEHRHYLESYLKEHTKGCASEETWLVLLREYSQDTERIRFFLELGCAHEENMDALLKDMGEEYPEMKAMFLRHQDTQIGYQDFFGGLEL